jgi:hypothetical protein
MMARRTVGWLLLPAVAVALAACGEKPQTASGKKSDAKPWEGLAQTTHSADGYKAGDKAVWEAQLKSRTERGQNEYTRTTTVVKP